MLNGNPKNRSKRHKKANAQRLSLLLSLVTRRALTLLDKLESFIAAPAKDKLIVRVHSTEKYPWHFPGVITERGTIFANDYALMDRKGAVYGAFSLNISGYRRNLKNAIMVVKPS